MVIKKEDVESLIIKQYMSYLQLNDMCLYFGEDFDNYIKNLADNICLIEDDDSVKIGYIKQLPKYYLLDDSFGKICLKIYNGDIDFEDGVKIVINNIKK